MSLLYLESDLTLLTWLSESTANVADSDICSQASNSNPIPFVGIVSSVWAPPLDLHRVLQCSLRQELATGFLASY